MPSLAHASSVRGVRLARAVWPSLSTSIMCVKRSPSSGVVNVSDAADALNGSVDGVPTTELPKHDLLEAPIAPLPAPAPSASASGESGGASASAIVAFFSGAAAGGEERRAGACAVFPFRLHEAGRQTCASAVTFLLR
eukprot:3936957-Prymnesium_polylepis.1